MKNTCKNCPDENIVYFRRHNKTYEGRIYHSYQALCNCNPQLLNFIADSNTEEISKTEYNMYKILK